jgi:hypothetical protein
VAKWAAPPNILLQKERVMSRQILIAVAVVAVFGALFAFISQQNDRSPDRAVATLAGEPGASAAADAETIVLAQAAKAPVDRRIVGWTREGWKTDFSRIEIDLDDILSGGPPRDGIPSIDNPEFIPVASEETLPDREPVLSLVVNGEARAYPLRIMMWHEIVNDVIGGLPVVVTYCPLCNAAIVFDAAVDGKAREFGTTGKLRYSDLIMYDRVSETWWQQFSGTGIIGKHAGYKLTMLPSRLETWGQFKTENPGGQVLVPNNSRMRQYWRNPYGGYDTAATPFLFRGALPEGIPAMERVVMIRADEPSAVSVALLREKGKIVDGDVVIKWEPGQASALDTSKIEDGRDVGTVTVTRASDGSPIIHDVTFAFVVNAFEPTLIIRTQ